MATTIGSPVAAAPEKTRFEPVEPSAPAVTAPAQKRERLVSLDVFRGITIAGMLLVNNPGTWGAIYPPLEHAAWNGWTPTDLIFPFFVFIVGVTTHLSITARRERGDSDAMLVKQVLRRGAIIFLLGFLMSLFPFYQWGPIEGMAHPSILERIVYRWEHVRILGVLQRIGLVYIAAGLLSLKTTLKQQVVIVAALLYGYWFAMTLIPVSGTYLGIPGTYIGAVLLNNPSETLAAHLDRAILGMLGIFAGRWIGKPSPLIERISGLFAVGSIGMVVGMMWNWVFPINKNLWTSSYVVFTAGMACVTLAAIMWIVDWVKIRWWTKPFVIYGMNPILAFVGSGVLARCIYTLWKVQYNGRPTAVESVIYKTVFEPWLEPKNASLAMAFVTVLFWFGILTWMYRKRIFLKV